MKLYKFRPLFGDWFDWIIELIRTGQFRLSEWDKLNDPMEGYFYYDSKYEDTIVLKDFLNLKKRRRICCFSKNMSDILHWAHYADSFKGVALEIEVEKDEKKIYPVEYIGNIEDIDLGKSNPIEVLTKKIKLWKNEKEYRYIDETEDDFAQIGIIKSVYFGTRTDINHKQEIKKVITKTYDTELDFVKNRIKKK